MTDENLQWAIRADSFSSEQLAILAEHSSCHVRLAVADTIQTSKDAAEVLAIVSTYDCPVLRDGEFCIQCETAHEHVILNDDMTSAALRNIARQHIHSTSCAVLGLLCEHWNADAETLGLASEGAPTQTRVTAALHSNADMSLLTRLSRDQDPEVQRAVASNPITPQDVLLAFATEGYGANVHKSVAMNPNSPPAALLRLAEMGNPIIGNFVSHQDQAPAEALHLLAAQEYETQAEVASHANTADETLVLLMCSEYEAVRLRASDAMRARLGQPPATQT